MGKEAQGYRNTIVKIRMNTKFGYEDDVETAFGKSDLEKEVMIQCKMCSFVGKTESGLRIHETRMHGR